MDKYIFDGSSGWRYEHHGICRWEIWRRCGSVGDFLKKFAQRMVNEGARMCSAPRCYSIPSCFMISIRLRQSSVMEASWVWPFSVRR